ncbi:ubiquinol-cytochrome c reductase iron-sulfur subunit [Hwanghaeella grinnelliae]|uniref:Ubiquinol-cytochrome c reductase iron-sulfur subunit n=1 Tax=Hwanghaeella grinnelliae TaxID=2500179 RepID=A0A437QN85_9PROT|nr:ubiquinol-cytochrome c reductase iron-sulfur subunit [Hwanghaeella grinnelliae]RVU35879.1 ubiquinol-cytochrome c reductase iron-sulfur subunit [Hwanghaeella grinnelliae]
MSESTETGHASEDGGSRRDFLGMLTMATAAVGAASFAWPIIDSMNPSAEVLALASTEVDLDGVEVGQAITVIWRKKPVFIRHRTPEEIAEAEAVPMDDLVDPETDEARVKNPNFLVMVGICTHLGCIPLGQNPSDPKGDFGGWFCPCHGSHYDTSGRIRKGPAPRNLTVPEYEYLSDTLVKIG